MTAKEQELFWALCRFQTANPLKLNELLPEAATPQVLGHLFYNRMQGVAYGVLKESGLLGQVHREFRDALKNAYLQNTIRNRSYRQALRILTEILSPYEGEYAMLKGAKLCMYYPKGYRTASDVDLLVRPENVSRIGAALTEAGFRQGNIRNGIFVPATRPEIITSKMTRGETVPYIMEVDLPFLQYLEVDINFSVDYKNSNSDTVNKLIDATQAYVSEDVRICTLSPCDFLIHLCAHLYKEASTMAWVRMKRDMTLYKYCDIALLLQNYTPEENHQLFQRAEELGMAENVACVIQWVRYFFPKIPDYILCFAMCYLESKKDLLDTVYSPAEHKLYRYTERSLTKRFFAEDRIALLEEV